MEKFLQMQNLNSNVLNVEIFVVKEEFPPLVME